MTALSVAVDIELSASCGIPSSPNNGPPLLVLLPYSSIGRTPHFQANIRTIRRRNGLMESLSFDPC